MCFYQVALLPIEQYFNLVWHAPLKIANKLDPSLCVCIALRRTFFHHLSSTELELRAAFDVALIEANFPAIATVWVRKKWLDINLATGSSTFTGNIVASTVDCMSEIAC